ncbi:MAG: Cyanophage [Pseudomonadota bacterium]
MAAGAEAEFTVTNTKVKATDMVVACIKDHTSAGTFIVGVSDVSDGSFKLQLTNLHASTAGNNVLVINFIVLKAEA